MDTITSLGWLLSALIVLAAIFIIIRQVVLWYFRLNQIADDIHYIAMHYRHVDYEVGRRVPTQMNGGSAPAPMVSRATRN